MDWFRIPVGDWVADGFDWVKDNLGGLLDGIDVGLETLVDGLTDALTAVPVLVLVVLFALIGWFVRSWKLGVGTLLSMLFVVAMDMWVPALQTLSLVLIATVITIVIAVPLGVLAARSHVASAILRPVLDFMQTMPAFVYLIPTVIFFSIGVVPGVVSTIIFSLPPGVRLTELGIRGVDREKVEAGQAFGATPRQILFGIQLPLASRTIMSGINQVIMLALSMAVVAGIAGADGLGKIVVSAISTLQVGEGVEAGLSVVVLAIFLDRVTSALGSSTPSRGSLLSLLRRGDRGRAVARAA
ncbi:proline/glycine betaine ABC transporter permease [Schumannella sp. 10F1B-5-1]|uniref:ABC transporter permease n=1 Tax=Schumannella sp. 10F1B-5-1 TaxID=2590780 RepID=UPI00113262A6|nr:ABC transporter permease subunit [Schumannella sp. 10F1B-5-1]TPW70101.1 ABC transporter permease subunit [Schumannella sp. 10F1B-5-1]